MRAVSHLPPTAPLRSADRCAVPTHGVSTPHHTTTATRWHPVFHPKLCAPVFDVVPRHAPARLISHAASASRSEASTSAGDAMASMPPAASAPSTSPSTTAAPSVELDGRDGRKLTRTRTWPRKKAEFYVLRSDGLSCSRETIQACGCLTWRHTSTQQELLVWKTSPRCVLVLKKLDATLDFQLDQVVAFLGLEEGLTVVVEAHDYRRMKAAYGWEFLESFDDDEKPQLHQVIDFVVCLGGDGVILHACTLFHSYVPPIIGFNLGSMGFLTNHEFDTFREDLRGVLSGGDQLEGCDTDDPDQGGVYVTLRMRLLCEVYRRGQHEPSEVHEVLNEVVVDRGSSPYLSKIECYERGRLVTRVQADGVLLATPTGSTAYSVAAGGSMAHPSLPAILFTPICPHSLSFRPVILPDYADLTLRIPDDARSSAWVCFDGKRRQELLHGDAVRVRMSPNPVPTINRTDQTTDWFGSLQRCFNWSDRVDQKPLGPHSVDAQQALIRQYSSSFGGSGGGGGGGGGGTAGPAGGTLRATPSSSSSTSSSSSSSPASVVPAQNAECVIDNDWSAAGSSAGTHAVERWTAQRVVGSASRQNTSSTGGVGGNGVGGNGVSNGVLNGGAFMVNGAGVNNTNGALPSNATVLMSTDSEDGSSMDEADLGLATGRASDQQQRGA